MTTIWMRAEEKPNERRSPIAPGDAGKLIAAGYGVHVEDDPARAHAAAAYRRAGCAIEAPGAWREAPADAWVIAVKELKEGSGAPLRRRHIHFGHIFKEQSGWRDAMRTRAEAWWLRLLSSGDPALILKGLRARAEAAGWPVISLRD